MANKHKIAEPIYQKIAIDIASKIAAGKYKAGRKNLRTLHACSSLRRFS